MWFVILLTDVNDIYLYNSQLFCLLVQYHLRSKSLAYQVVRNINFLWPDILYLHVALENIIAQMTFMDGIFDLVIKILVLLLSAFRNVVSHW
jgi:hypothetical protein